MARESVRGWQEGGPRLQWRGGGMDWGRGTVGGGRLVCFGA